MATQKNIPPQNSEEMIEQFANGLLREQGYSSFDDEFVKVLKTDLIDRINNRINALILFNMPREDLEAFEEVLDQDGDEVRVFCEAKIPNLPQLVANELLRFRQEYLTT